MLKANKIIEDVQKLKELYGDGIDIEVGDDYYRCYFKNSIGLFKFLVSDIQLDKPYGISFEDEADVKLIKNLQEV